MNKFAFLFTGQGAQAVGMLNGFAGNPWSSRPWRKPRKRWAWTSAS
jgi:malonyl CoA-acyl carrier protein transacylase